MKLNELFSTVIEWQWYSKTASYMDATFRVDDVNYTVYFSDEERPKSNTWQVEFSASGKHVKSEQGYKLTGSGNAALIFSTVIDIIKDFRTRHPTVSLVFTAEEPSRESLYAAIVKKMSPSAVIHNGTFTIPPKDVAIKRLNRV